MKTMNLLHIIQFWRTANRFV